MNYMAAGREIPNLLDVAPLVGPPPMKIRVVMFFAHCPLWPLHKKHLF
jgi:hypothetical protein